MLLERELELHSKRHEQAQGISRDEVAVSKLRKTLADLCSQRDVLQLRLNRNVTDGEGEGAEVEGEGAERLQEVTMMILLPRFSAEMFSQIEDAIDAADAQAEYSAHS